MDFETANKELDEYFAEIPKILEVKIENPVILISQAEKLRDAFRVHLQNQRKPENSDSIMLDQKTLTNLKDFNEGAVRLLQSYKECEEKEILVSGSPNYFKSLDEFRSHVIRQREIISCEFIKLQSVEDNLETILDILKNYNGDPDDTKTPE